MPLETSETDAAEQVARKNVTDREIAEEKARIEETTPHVIGCPYCRHPYPKANKDKTEFTCKNGDCGAVFSVDDVKAPRNLYAEELAKASKPVPERAPGGLTPNDVPSSSTKIAAEDAD